MKSSLIVPMFPRVSSLMKMLKEEEEMYCQFVYVFIWCYLKIDNNLGNPDFIDEKDDKL
jgi:hypothetical protein